MNKQPYDAYTEEFKKSSVDLALENDQPYAQTARELGVKASTFYTWIERYSLSKESDSDNMESELKKLRKEITKLRMERDILKKAAAYFAKHTK